MDRVGWDKRWLDLRQAWYGSQAGAVSHFLLLVAPISLSLVFSSSQSSNVMRFCGGGSKPVARKLVVCGDGACGKTSLLNVFTRGYFPQVRVLAYAKQNKVDIECIVIHSHHLGL